MRFLRSNKRGTLVTRDLGTRPPFHFHAFIPCPQSPDRGEFPPRSVLHGCSVRGSAGFDRSAGPDHYPTHRSWNTQPSGRRRGRTSWRRRRRDWNSGESHEPDHSHSSHQSGRGSHHLRPAHHHRSRPPRRSAWPGGGLIADPSCSSGDGPNSDGNNARHHLSMDRQRWAYHQ